MRIVTEIADSLQTPSQSNRHADRHGERTTRAGNRAGSTRGADARMLSSPAFVGVFGRCGQYGRLSRAGTWSIDVTPAGATGMLLRRGEGGDLRIDIPLLPIFIEVRWRPLGPVSGLDPRSDAHNHLGGAVLLARGRKHSSRPSCELPLRAGVRTTQVSGRRRPTDPRPLEDWHLMKAASYRATHDRRFQIFVWSSDCVLMWLDRILQGCSCVSFRRDESSP